jgi:N-carbamoylputrescine amidase
MKITVCEFPDEQEAKENAWAALVGYLAPVKPDIVVLPEMPFCDWIFGSEVVDVALWRNALAQHDAMIARLAELSCRWVTSSRPIEESGQRFNEAFIWSAGHGYQPVRRKWYLPEVPVARETLWFWRGDRHFLPVRIGGADVSFQLCSEIMFTHHARDIGLAGAHLVIQPRATGRGRRWKVASEMSAIASGSYVASANRRTTAHELFSGGSWLISPEAHTICETTEAQPFVTAEIELATAERAKQQFPRDLYRTYRD